MRTSMSLHTSEKSSHLSTTDLINNSKDSQWDVCRQVWRQLMTADKMTNKKQLKQLTICWQPRWTPIVVWLCHCKRTFALSGSQSCLVRFSNPLKPQSTPSNPVQPPYNPSHPSDAKFMSSHQMCVTMRWSCTAGEGRGLSLLITSGVISVFVPAAWSNVEVLYKSDLLQPRFGINSRWI